MTSTSVPRLPNNAGSLAFKTDRNDLERFAERSTDRNALERSDAKMSGESETFLERSCWPFPLQLPEWQCSGLYGADNPNNCRFGSSNSYAQPTIENNAMATTKAIMATAAAATEALTPPWPASPGQAWPAALFAAMAQIDEQQRRLQQTRLCLLASMLPAAVLGSSLVGGAGDVCPPWPGLQPAPSWEGGAPPGAFGGREPPAMQAPLLQPSPHAAFLSGCPGLDRRPDPTCR